MEKLLGAFKPDPPYTLNGLPIDSAREFVIEKIIPMVFLITSDFTAINLKDMLVM